MQGHVKWFNRDKGYGYLTVPGHEDVFVHYRNIETTGHRQLFEGQLVDFDTTPGVRGLQAIHVHPHPQKQDRPQAASLSILPAQSAMGSLPTNTGDEPSHAGNKATA